MGAKVWMSYFLNSASFHSPLWMRRSVTSVTWGLSSIPDAAASFPRSVREISLSVTIFSPIIPWRPFRSFTIFGSASFSGTGPCAILFRSASSGISDESMLRPLSVSTSFLESPSLTMSARFFLLSHPTAILSAPPGMASARAFMSMLPPAASMHLMATLSGSPDSTMPASAST